MQLTGIHHLTAVTSDVTSNLAFYTKTLGLRLVKKTVNQDDTSSYHLFYADGVGSAGTDITFFDWPSKPARRGTRSIGRTGFRIAENSIAYWLTRFAEHGVTHAMPTTQFDRRVIEFEDGEGQRLALVADADSVPPHPWAKSPVPTAHQLHGLGPITISVPELGPTQLVLENVLNMTRAREEVRSIATDGSPSETIVHAFTMNGGGDAHHELHVAVEPDLPRGIAGAGGTHHVAFRIPDDTQYDAWAKRLGELNVPTSGPVDRYYFRSLYFREPSGVLFELATDGPGFASDEPMESLGEKLSLPPFLEGKRKGIEAGLKAI